MNFKAELFLLPLLVSASSLDYTDEEKKGPFYGGPLLDGGFFDGSF